MARSRQPPPAGDATAEVDRRPRIYRTDANILIGGNAGGNAARAEASALRAALAARDLPILKGRQGWNAKRHDKAARRAQQYARQALSPGTASPSSPPQNKATRWSSVSLGVR